MSSHHLCHVLLARSKCRQVLTTLKGRGVYKCVNARRWASLGSILESTHHHIICSKKLNIIQCKCQKVTPGQESSKIQDACLSSLAQRRASVGFPCRLSFPLRLCDQPDLPACMVCPGFEDSANRSDPHTAQALQVSTSQRPPFTELIPYPSASSFIPGWKWSSLWMGT